MLPSGIFWAFDDTGIGPVLTAATDPGEVVRQRPVATHLDGHHLADYLRLRASPESTPYVGVGRLLPGHTLQWRLGSAPEVVQWCGPHTWDDQQDVSIEEYLDVFDAVIGQILRASPTVVAHVSGGLDSTFAAASAARIARLTGPILGCVAAPVPQAPPTRDGRIHDEAPFARSLELAYPRRIFVSVVRNVEGVQPLDAAAAASQRSWLPCFAPANQVWLDLIQDRAAATGARLVLSGAHGNWSFSPYFPPSGLPRRLRLALRGTQAPPGPSRAAFLAGLSYQRYPMPGSRNPAALRGLLYADPFSARPVLDLAAAIPSRVWGMEPWPRGFARTAAQGRVPDAIRLRRSRGAQAPDVWWWIRDQRDRYAAEAAALRGWSLAEEVDSPAIAELVASWPWGQPCGPDPDELRWVHRVLSVAAFERMTEERLRATSIRARRRGPLSDRPR